MKHLIILIFTLFTFNLSSQVPVETIVKDMVMHWQPGTSHTFYIGNNQDYECKVIAYVSESSNYIYEVWLNNHYIVKTDSRTVVHFNLKSIVSCYYSKNPLECFDLILN